MGNAYSIQKKVEFNINKADNFLSLESNHNDHFFARVHVQDLKNMFYVSLKWYMYMYMIGAISQI